MGGSVNKQIAALVVATVILTAVTLADAQQQSKIHKIGWLSPGSGVSATRIELFLREFRKLGYVEGNNITF